MSENKTCEKCHTNLVKCWVEMPDGRKCIALVCEYCKLPYELIEPDE